MAAKSMIILDFAATGRRDCIHGCEIQVLRWRPYLHAGPHAPLSTIHHPYLSTILDTFRTG